MTTSHITHLASCQNCGTEVEYESKADAIVVLCDDCAKDTKVGLSWSLSDAAEEDREMDIHREESDRLARKTAEVIGEVVLIARCPTHGLHGERDECFVCRGPVEKVPMVELRREP